MSVQVDIGKVSAISVNHDWMLELKANVHFSGPNIPIPKEDVLSWIKQCSPWMNRGNGLQLVLEVDQNDLLRAQGQQAEIIMEALGKALLSARLWAQLRLDVTLVNQPTTPSRSKITLDIRYAVDTDVPEPRRLHRLPVAASAGDVRPPAGVNECQLERITLNIALRKQEEDAQSDHGIIASSSALMRKSSSVDAHVRHPHCVELRNNHEDDMLDNNNEHILEESPLLLDIRDETSVYPGASQSISLGHSSSQCACHNHHGTSSMGTSTKDAIELADAAIRSVICPRPPKLALGVWLPDPEPTLSLARLAPVLWLPGYAMAVAERACFLPTLSHALCHSLPKRARSAGLKAKLAKLQDILTAPGVNNGNYGGEQDGDEIVYQRSFSELVTARLWKMIQQGVYNEDTVKDLKPLTSPSDPSPIASEEMFVPLTRHIEDARVTALTNDAYTPNSTSAVRAQVDNLVTRSSPILLGRLNLSGTRAWDGGLLAQPVHGLVTGLLESWHHTNEIQVQGEDGDDELFDDKDDEYEDEMISLFGASPDDYDLFSVASPDSLLNNDETPFSSQESALALQFGQQAIRAMEESDMFESTCDLTEDRPLRHPLHVHDAMDLDLLEDTNGADNANDEDMFDDLEDEDMLAF